ncbi:metal ABC transporter permease [Candidatus Uabimicrobium sp. HlEnr_7]|uniref:metal ABC transporter permease n=1 Tax=Candidatus Uabimicrobium helgolandensis TaxID=3095367 RepID=UPI0035570BFF
MDFYTHWSLFGNAYITCLLLATCCAFLGVYVVLRRIIFFGVAVIQLAALGVAFSFLFAWNPIICAAITSFAGIALFLKLDNSRISKENLIGIIYIAAGAFSLLIIKQSAIGTEELKDFFYGNILLTQPQQIQTMLIMFVVVLLYHIVFFSQTIFVAFDRTMAETLGVKVKLWDALFFFSLGGVIAVSTKAAGSLLVFGYLILPATTALISTKRVKTMFVASIFYAILASIVGLYIQHQWEFPPAQSIVAVSTVLLIVVSSYCYRNFYGILIGFCILLILGLLLPTNTKQNQHSHSHSPKIQAEIAITTSTTFKQLQTKKQLSLHIENYQHKDIVTYLQIDISIEIYTIKVNVKADQSISIPIDISPNVIDLLDKEQDLLLSCWEDKEATIPDDIVLTSAVIKVR